MIIPVILDTCTIINLLRIDEEDKFLYNMLIKLDLNICQKVYQETYKTINQKTFTESQKEYIDSLVPTFGAYIKNIDESFKEEYSDRIRSFCSYHKDNGEFYSTLLSLYLCRENGCRVCFYTDDYPAKETFYNYFTFQQIGTIGDTVDLLLLLYWSNTDFKLIKLKKYLFDLYSEFATPIKVLFDKICENKEQWINDMPRDKKLCDNLYNIEIALKDVNLSLINKTIAFFSENKSKYKEICKLLDAYPTLLSDAGVAKKLKEIINYTRLHTIYKKEQC